MLIINDLQVQLGDKVILDHIDLEIKPGETHVLFGPNGSGKTSLLMTIMGYPQYKVVKGRISFKGEDIIGRRPHRVAMLGVSRTFQNLQMFFNMSVLDNVMVGCHLRTRSGLISAALRLPRVIREEEQARQWAREALEVCNLDHFIDQQADALPYGVLKRLEIARALAARPSLLMMDEPAAGLNETETVEMRNLIRSICDTGVTVLLVEHNMGLVMQVSDRILVLDYGSRLAEGTPAEIQNDPSVIQAYLGGEVQYAV